jgi:hypothetical protein
LPLIVAAVLERLDKKGSRTSRGKSATARK